MIPTNIILETNGGLYRWFEPVFPDRGDDHRDGAEPVSTSPSIDAGSASLFPVVSA